ncbi:MAG: MCE family protein [Sedimentisphaerales bacterium]|nr:MCE family protein [Sedimentisphaerales bacterium]
MDENRRNLIVGFFVIVGLAFLGWLVFKMGNLPALLSRYDARIITIYFPEAPGIQENTVVLFRGYRVGKVVQINPPALLSDPEFPDQEYYQVVMSVAIDKNFPIPLNVQPQIYRRGLGGSSIDLDLRDPPSTKLIVGGEVLKGIVSETSEFISEKTQTQLDQLINSFNDLSAQIKSQLVILPPEEVDLSDSDQVRANVTTAVMRLDQSLKYLNVYLGDEQNQQNFKKGLEDFANVAEEVHEAVVKIKEVADEARTLIAKISQTTETIGQTVNKAGGTFADMGVTLQQTADQLNLTLNHLDEIIIRVSKGEGSMGRIFNDPRLYEAITDAMDNLNLAIDELHTVLEGYQQEGLKLNKEIKVF